MKKLLLIPITLTALAPMVSMVGCNQEDISIYQANEQERIDAVSLKNVEYLQYIETKQTTTFQSELVSTETLIAELSPTVYHSILTIKDGQQDTYVERFVVKRGDNDYWLYYRSSPSQTTWVEWPTTADYFTTIGRVGYENLAEYNDLSNYQFIQDKKCYIARAGTPDSAERSNSYYFKNKILNKSQYYSHNGEIEQNTTTDREYTYKKITPPLPTVEI